VGFVSPDATNIIVGIREARVNSYTDKVRWYGFVDILYVCEECKIIFGGFLST
jgi:hypothetical protein